MLVNRLHTDKDLLYKYDEIIKQQVKNNIIKEVDVTKPSDTKLYYLPHHPILTPDKETTKIRIVYDASANSSLRKPLRISVLVMRYIKVKVWNRIEEKQKCFKDCLLITIFQRLSDRRQVSAREIQLIGLLRICFIQHNCYDEVLLC